MGNMRAKYLIGTTITSLALVTAALVWALPLGDDQTSAKEAGAIYGHVSLMVVFPDGTTSYQQGDNEIQFEGKTAAAAQLWNDGTFTGFNCITLGSDSAAATDAQSTGVGDAGVLADLNTPQECADGAGNSITVGIAASAGQADVTNIVVEFDIVGTDNGATLAEVSLDNEANATMSRFDLVTDLTVTTGTKVTVNYTMTTG